MKPGSALRTAQVLRFLLQSNQPRSGQEMGQKLGCSRAAVGKAVTALRAQGFVIQARPRAGYQLLSEPELLLPARVGARLEPGGLGTPYWHFMRIPSTNLEARRRAEQGAPHGACLAAEFQTAGRGRLDRTWNAPARSCLLFSLILRPALGLEMVFGLTSLAALGICLALEGLYGLKPMIKWPNDLYLDGRKLAGVLTEFTSRAERVEFAVVGVGLNVNLTPNALAKLPAPAASVRQATGQRQDRALILVRILKEMDRLYTLFAAGRQAELTGAYEERSFLAGRMVQVRDADQLLQGRVQGMAGDGALILKTKAGQRIIRHGDVSVISYKD